MKYLLDTHIVSEPLRPAPNSKVMALSLYAQSILSFGKAREMARLSKYEFGLLLGQRGIPRHYDPDDRQDDLAYVHRE